MKRKSFHFQTRSGERFEVEIVKTQKEIFGKIENMSDLDLVCILYNDGGKRYISTNNRQEKINKRNISSMVFSKGEESYSVYGNYNITVYGMVKPSEVKIIDDSIYLY